MMPIGTGDEEQHTGGVCHEGNGICKAVQLDAELLFQIGALAHSGNPPVKEIADTGNHQQNHRPFQRVGASDVLVFAQQKPHTRYSGKCADVSENN